jgi:hypothetical protein
VLCYVCWCVQGFICSFILLQPAAVSVYMRSAGIAGGGEEGVYGVRVRALTTQHGM